MPLSTSLLYDLAALERGLGASGSSSTAYMNAVENYVNAFLSESSLRRPTQTDDLEASRVTLMNMAAARAAVPDRIPTAQLAEARRKYVDAVYRFAMTRASALNLALRYGSGVLQAAAPSPLPPLRLDPMRSLLERYEAALRGGNPAAIEAARRAYIEAAVRRGLPPEVPDPRAPGNMPPEPPPPVAANPGPLPPNLPPANLPPVGLPPVGDLPPDMIRPPEPSVLGDAIVFSGALVAAFLLLRKLVVRSA